jgi:hypothetical protein
MCNGENIMAMGDLHLEKVTDKNAAREEKG